MGCSRLPLISKESLQGSLVALGKSASSSSSGLLMTKTAAKDETSGQSQVGELENVPVKIFDNQTETHV